MAHAFEFPSHCHLSRHTEQVDQWVLLEWENEEKKEF